VAGIVAVLAAVAAFFWIWSSRSHLGGHAGDEIAKRVEGECGASTRKKVDPSDFQAPEFSRQATDLTFITCPSGYVNPFAELSQFSSPTALERAYKRSGPKVRLSWYCLAGREAISGDFRDFSGLCKELGGHFRCPAPCEARVRAHRIPPVPGEPD
jgi:hypothetical protein